jgi:hypothetical protein
MLISHVHHRKPTTQAHRYRGALLGEHDATGPKKAVLQRAVERLPVERMTVSPERVDDGADLDRPVKQQVIDRWAAADGRREKAIRTWAATERQQLFP